MNHLKGRFNLKLSIFWICTGILLFLFLQNYYSYLFYFKEQSQLFLVDISWFRECVSEPGGLSIWLSQFLMQFFVYPYIGALITSILLTLTACVTGCVLKKITKSSVFIILGWIPVIAQLCAMLDINYFYQGTIVFVEVVCLFYLCLLIKSVRFRLFVELFCVLLLSVIAGSGNILFACLVFLYESINLDRRKWISVLPLVMASVLTYCIYYCGWISEMKFAFLPDAYYHKLLSPKPIIYYSWITIMLVIGLALSLHLKGLIIKERKIQYLIITINCLLVCGWGYWCFSRYGEWKMNRYMELDYYSRTEQWDKIQNNCKGKLTNYLYMNILARSLSEQGRLVDDLLKYQIRNESGLAVEYNNTEDIAVLLSDIYFTAGNIALSQRLAFEGCACARGNFNVRLLQRLIQTNIIYGEYKVAEKYIGLLEKSLTYKKWAKEYRKYLYNDKLVNEDVLLGTKRQLLLSVKDTTGLKVSGTAIENSMALPVIANPQKSQIAFQYLMCTYLLRKDMKSFLENIETYYKTPLLPTLPFLFQEALIVAYENNPEGLNQYSLDSSVKNRYTEFRKQILANRNNGGLASMMYRGFGNSYWYYFIFR